MESITDWASRWKRESPLLEALALFTLLVGYALVVYAAHLGVEVQMVCTAAWLCGLVVLSWRNFARGMHPAFLFLGLLLLFQGGGLLGFIVSGGDADPMKIMLASVPFDVSYDVKRSALLLLLLSATIVYSTVRTARSELKFVPPASERLLPWILLIFVVSLPFHFYKNYEYFDYVRSHGGYLAIFRSDEHVAEVGFLVRAMSQVCSSAFLVYFVYERPRWRLALLSMLYIGVSLLELLIGLRGKVLLFFICLLFLYKLKRGTGFALRGLVFLALGLILTAQAVEVFREKKSEKFDATKAPAIFLASEGVSLNQTEAVIAFYPQFAPYRWAYIKYALLGTFQARAEAQASRPQGQVLADDSGMFLNKTGFALGFGTGGSYLAESYLYGKMLGVVGESLLIGWLLVLLARNFQSWRTPFAWSAMIGLIYLPREDLLVAIPGILRAWAGVGLVFGAAWGGATALRWAKELGLGVARQESATQG